MILAGCAIMAVIWERFLVVIPMKMGIHLERQMISRYSCWILRHLLDGAACAGMTGGKGRVGFWRGN
jgi:hypothetical protein